jgi:hypothetical protein
VGGKVSYVADIAWVRETPNARKALKFPKFPVEIARPHCYNKHHSLGFSPLRTDPFSALYPLTKLPFIKESS